MASAWVCRADRPKQKSAKFWWIGSQICCCFDFVAPVQVSIVQSYNTCSFSIMFRLGLCYGKNRDVTRWSDCMGTHAAVISRSTTERD